ncbi:MAG: toxin-antitoxin system YwqK family antitoxin [Planctomycetota bacterium]|jgi:antitoxin component YwqK of YwqJK toxin-antitoxin module
MPGTLYFDEEGFPHGTGSREYFYESGVLKLKERYINGRLYRSVWFRPDGKVVATTNWKDETGVGYYLREDGSIRVKMHYVNGFAHGQATYYREDGLVERYAEFRNGVEVNP